MRHSKRKIEFLKDKVEKLKDEVLMQQNSLIAANADYEELKALHATEVAELKQEHCAVATTLAILSKDQAEVDRLKIKKAAADKAEKEAKAKLAAEKERQLSDAEIIEEETSC